MTYAIGPHVTAESLSGKDIGKVIQFNWEMDGSKLLARITGELRQVYHTSAETVINATSHTEDTAGEMSEFVLDPGHEITMLVKSS